VLQDIDGTAPTALQDDRLSRTTDEDAIIQRGRDALELIEKDPTFPAWLEVGAALLVGRAGAMHRAGTNKPAGRHYNSEFGSWLAEHRLDRVDKAARSNLFKVLDRRDEVLAWREELPADKRLQLNHPTTVWRKFKAATQKPTQASAETTTPVLIDTWKAANDEVKTRLLDLVGINEILRVMSITFRNKLNKRLLKEKNDPNDVHDKMTAAFRLAMGRLKIMDGPKTSEPVAQSHVRDLLDALRGISRIHPDFTDLAVTEGKTSNDRRRRAA
jgi:hypothetical protein